jgi:hypothetical protein
MGTVRKVIKLTDTRSIEIDIKYRFMDGGESFIPTTDEANIVEDMDELISQTILGMQDHINSMYKSPPLTFNRGGLTAYLNYLVDEVMAGKHESLSHLKREDIIRMVAGGLTFPYINDYEHSSQEQYLFDNADDFNTYMSKASCRFIGTTAEHCAQAIIDKVNDIYSVTPYLNKVLHSDQPVAVFHYYYIHTGHAGMTFRKVGNAVLNRIKE